MNKIEHYLKLATPQEIVNGLQWYRKAHKTVSQIADKYELKRLQVGGVLSALSPAMKWETNVRYTDLACSLHYKGKPITKIRYNTYPAQVRKAQKILDLDKPTVKTVLGCLDNGNAQKTRAFFINILFPDRTPTVTIDRWILRALKWHRIGSPTKNQYKALEKQFRSVAIRYRLAPAQIQAIVWNVVRNLNIQEATA